MCFLRVLFAWLWIIFIVSGPCLCERYARRVCLKRSRGANSVCMLRLYTNQSIWRVRVRTHHTNVYFSVRCNIQNMATIHIWSHASIPYYTLCIVSINRTNKHTYTHTRYVFILAFSYTQSNTRLSIYHTCVLSHVANARCVIVLWHSLDVFTFSRRW